MRIETKRLVLGRWRPEDLEPFAAMGADPKVMEFFPALLSREETAASIARMEEKFESHGFCFWALERKHDGAFLGFAGLNQPNFLAPFMPCIEIGWRARGLDGSPLADPGLVVTVPALLRKTGGKTIVLAFRQIDLAPVLRRSVGPAASSGH